jgi:hypothetical protein
VRTNPFYDAWLFLIGRTSDHANSGVGWLLTLLFLVLLAASILIARANWRQDPAQRSGRHLAIFFMRLMIGIMWYQGSLWKLPLPVSGGFAGWTASLGENAAFEFHRWIAKNIFVPLLPVIDPLVYLTELSLAVAFMLGFLVRGMGTIGMLFVAHLWLGLYRLQGEWPWQYIFLIFVQGFFVLDAAGRSLGLDGILGRAQVGAAQSSGRLARLYRRLA